jgi:predicted nucleic acid-binding protein
VFGGVRNWQAGCPASRFCPATRRSPPAVAAIWGRLSAAAIQRGRPRPVNDMWVAACCLAYEVPLVTLNIKDYEDFKEHHGLRILRAE